MQTALPLIKPSDLGPKPGLQRATLPCLSVSARLVISQHQNAPDFLPHTRWCTSWSCKPGFIAEAPPAHASSLCPDSSAGCQCQVASSHPHHAGTQGVPATSQLHPETSLHAKYMVQKHITSRTCPCALHTLRVPRTAKS